VAKLRGLAAKGVIKGADDGFVPAYVHTPRSGRANGTPTTLLDEQDGPVWYCSRMLRDEHSRQVKGASSRFPKGGAGPDSSFTLPRHGERHGERQGDGSSSSSSSSSFLRPIPGDGRGLEEVSNLSKWGGAT
jgi:hypothetical protein